MAEVRTYDQLVVPSPGPQQSRINVRADPMAFGGGVGEGLTSLSKSMQQVAESQWQAEQLVKKNDVQDRLAAFGNDRRTATAEYGNTEGMNAVNGYKAYQDTLHKSMQERGKGLTGDAADMFRRAAEQEASMALSAGMSHRGEQLKVATTAASKGRVEGAQQDALLYYSDPKKVTTMIGAGVAEIRQQAAMMGQDPTQVEKNWISDTHFKITLKMAETSASEALKYAKSHPITSDDMLKLEPVLKKGMVSEDAMKFIGDPAHAGLRPGSAPALQNAIRGHEEYAPLVQQNEQRRGLANGQVSRTIAYESGWNPNAQSPTGPKGLGQFTAATARQYGGNPLNPQDAIRMTADLAGDNKEAMERIIGRAARPGEVYMAHQQGVGNGNNGATGLMLHPDEPAWKIVGMSAVVNNLPKSLQDRASTMTAKEFMDHHVNGFENTSAAVPPRHYFADRQREIDKVEDPATREEIMKRYAAMDAAEAADANANHDAAVARAQLVLQTGGTVDDVPIEDKLQMGMAGETALWEYQKNRNARNDVTTDPVTYDALIKEQAKDAVAFITKDLSPYFGKLSTADQKKFSDLKADAIRDGVTAQQKGTDYTGDQNLVEDIMKGAGIGVPAGNKPEEKAAADKQVAEFRKSFEEATKAAEAQKKAKLDSEEKRKIARGLVAQADVQTPGTFYTSHEDSWMFHAPNVLEGQVVMPKTKVADMTLAMKLAIKNDLIREGNANPSNPEIERRYFAVEANIPLSLIDKVLGPAGNVLPPGGAAAATAAPRSPDKLDTRTNLNWSTPADIPQGQPAHPRSSGQLIPMPDATQLMGTPAAEPSIPDKSAGGEMGGPPGTGYDAVAPTEPIKEPAIVTEPTQPPAKQAPQQPLRPGQSAPAPAAPPEPGKQAPRHPPSRQAIQPPAQPKKFMAVMSPPGLVKTGNIDLNTRPTVKNADGTVSTVRSMSYEEDGKEILIPTVSDEGKIMTAKEAIAYWKKKGQYLGIFDTPEQATAYAEKLHKQQAGE